ncbi:MAG: hypothetical protein K2M19_02470 [Muribaculaceae bacterium]|nr:hypothetical protein [Muribaculaceae bacterium]
MKNDSITLRPLWLNHIERYSDRLRPRLYAALISYLRNGTPVPEKLLPHLGIIIDLIEAEKGEGTTDTVSSPGQDTHKSLTSNIPAPPAQELEYFRTFTEDCARRCCEEYKIDRDTFIATARAILNSWQNPLSPGGPVRHKDENDFWAHMIQAVHHEFTVTRRITIQRRQLVNT